MWDCATENLLGGGSYAEMVSGVPLTSWNREKNIALIARVGIVPGLPSARPRPPTLEHAMLAAWWMRCSSRYAMRGSRVAVGTEYRAKTAGAR